MHQSWLPACDDVDLFSFLSCFFACFLFSAVNQLAYNRLTSLCNKLEVDDELVSVGQ